MSARRGIRRPDFREVRPTDEEKAAWYKKNPRHAPPYRAVHIPCGKRMWYSGIGIGSHLRSCKPGPVDQCGLGEPHAPHIDVSAGPCGGLAL